MSDTKRGRGRPPMRPEDRKRNNVTMRLRDTARAALERAAAQNGRSTSEEIEYRIEQSLTADADAFFPPRLRMILQNVSATMLAAGTVNAHMRPKLLEDHAWLADPRCYRAATLSAARMLWRYDPEPNDPAAQLQWLNRLYELFQQDAASSAAWQKSREPEADWLEAARRLGLEIIDIADPPDPERHQ